jgi:FtsP/CotA-like multicopper oxidase with cupredoxin domain
MKPTLSRRQLLAATTASFGMLAGCSSSLPSTGDSSTTMAASGSAPTTEPSNVTATAQSSAVPKDADQQRALTARTGPISPAGDGDSNPTWLYNGRTPGPELRVAESDVLRVDLTNRLPDPTTIHWHGVPLANPMDGVPNITQAPVEPDGSFTYTFEAAPAGTYFYHSHVGLQLDRHLIGPLIVEEESPHVAFDRDIVVLFNDYLTSAPRPESEWTDQSGGGMMGGGGMNTASRPEYAGLLANGRLPSNPPEFTVEKGERLRVRFINASGATTFGVGVGGHPLNITHADGRPVEPVATDSFMFGPGERYDAVVEATNPGVWAIEAQSVDGDERPASATLRYEGATGEPRGPSFDGSQLEYGDLRAVESTEGLQGSPDRTFDVTLSAGRDPGTWLIDGQRFPDADPLQVSAGEHVRLRMRNRSPVVHPMHLHGHFFRVGDAFKDTVMVPGHMGRVTIDFLADNPGEWLFHCHNIYHLDGGMARIIEYAD